VTTDSNGDFSQSTLGLGEYTLTYTKSGYLNEIRYDTLETDNQTLKVETITQLPDSCSSGTVSGNITDAVTGDNVISVRVTAYDPWPFRRIERLWTNNSGEYSFSSMDPGSYYVWTYKTGYISEYFWVSVCGNKANQDNSISTNLPVGAMRIILKWPKTDPVTAQDLDSNLNSPNSAGNGWDRIYYSNLIEEYGADTVTLDKDDKVASGAPPGDETNTISKVRSGTYIYQVHNWTDKAGNTDARKTNFKKSGAKVKVYYNPGTCCTTKRYSVPNDNGTLWGVFTFDKDRIPSFIASDNMSNKRPADNNTVTDP